jgi:hypothetical protein
MSVSEVRLRSSRGNAMTSAVWLHNERSAIWMVSELFLNPQHNYTQIHTHAEYGNISKVAGHKK